LAHFVPDKSGVWTWTVSFRQGRNLAIGDSTGAGVSAGYFDQQKGSIVVQPTSTNTDKVKSNKRDLRNKGRLEYVGSHYLQFRETGEYFVKAGTHSPENLLAYDEFDNTPNNKKNRMSWTAHVRDFNNNTSLLFPPSSSTTWRGGKGKGIIGAINYLAVQGMNVFSFLTISIAGDDRNVYPYVSDKDYSRFDVSKLAQWEVLFDHADKIGMYLHFKTQEQENDQLLDKDDKGNELVFGNNRRLYYRELIARFGHHLALNWNIGEETTNTNQQHKLFASYLRSLDPYKQHHIVLHTFPTEKDQVYGKSAH
jgi:hypothetical protein